jgi:hypothetical protein
MYFSLRTHRMDANVTGEPAKITVGALETLAFDEELV